MRNYWAHRFPQAAAAGVGGHRVKGVLKGRVVSSVRAERRDKAGLAGPVVLVVKVGHKVQVARKDRAVQMLRIARPEVPADRAPPGLLQAAAGVVATILRRL